MTEYEIATLAIRTLGHWIAAGQLLIGIGQIAVVWFGIRVMCRTADQRAQAMDDDRRRADQRHEEAMLALRTLIERTAPTTDAS